MATTPHEFGDEDDDVVRRAKRDFTEFLNGTRPPMFVADSLAFLLRTEPPIHLEPAELFEIMAAWAVERADETNQPVSAILLGALRRILDAYKLDILPAFDPEAFFVIASNHLAAECPPGEAAGFRSGVRDLVIGGAVREFRRRDEPATAGEVVIGGTRMPVKAAQETAISRIEREAYMNDAEFAEAFADLQVALSSRLGIPIHTALARISKAAVSVFNTGRVQQAVQLFAFVEEAFDRLSISHEGQAEVRSAVTLADFNEGLLGKVLNDTEQRSSAGPLTHVVGSFEPGDALVTLGVEARRERRRLFLNAIEAYGQGAVPVILDHLAASASTRQPWYLTRNLLYLLSRLDVRDEPSRRRAVESVGRYVTNDLPQLRSASMAALARIGGKETVPYAVRVLEPAAYPPGSIDDTEQLKRHLLMAMELLVETGNDAAITIVAEMATGARGGEFDLGQVLRDEACSALSRRKAPLPRRAAVVIATALQSIVGKRFKIVTGKLAFGVDPHQCRQLSALLRDSREPEAIEVLANPVLERMLSLAQH